MTRALGFRILDLSQFVAGPYCTRMLAGFGADVIKVERPGLGDLARRTGPFLSDEPGPETSALHLYLNAGKRSVTLDLSTATGQAILGQLAGTADAIVTSFRPATLERLNLMPAEWIERFPKLAFLAITNFGLTGPYRDFPASEITMEAMGGLLYITGEPDRPPLKDPGYQSQYVAGLNGYTHLLAALWERRKSGEGQVIDVSIAACFALLLENTIMRWSYAKQVRKRGGVFRSSIYPCRDGYVGVFDGAGRYWRQISELMDEPRLMDPKYATSFQRTDTADEIDSLMLPWLVERDREEIFHQAQQRRLPFGPIRTMREVVHSPHLQERGFFPTVDHPVAGAVTAPAGPYRLPASPWQQGRAPLLGEHTTEVLGEIGYSAADLVSLRERAVI